MSDRTDSRGGPRRIEVETRRRFVAALRSGASREDAAAAAGFSPTGLYNARRLDPAFAAEVRFAATGEPRPSAAEAGVHESTVHLHRRTDPVFAEAYAPRSLWPTSTSKPKPSDCASPPRPACAPPSRRAPQILPEREGDRPKGGGGGPAATRPVPGRVEPPARPAATTRPPTPSSSGS